jgi:chromosomal replication initiator protein
LIDDVQFLEGKIKVQEEFFHTFNAVQREGGQVVLTSDRPPHEIDRLEERLQSRFEGGLLVDMQNPDFELRCAILRIKAGQKNVELPISVAQILAANSESIRRLEGWLTRLITEAHVKNLPITEELAAQIVGKPITKNEAAKLDTPKQVAEAVVKRFGVTVGQLKGPKRSRPLARPRQVLMYLLRTQLELPLEEVGMWVGGRDHTTVMHAVEKVSGLLSTSEDLRGSVEWIKKEVFG